MLDLGQRWPDVPDFTRSLLHGTDFTLRPLPVLPAWLVSGNLEAFGAATGLSGTGAGALGTTEGDRYTVRLARSRLMAVGLSGAELIPGWNEAGFAASEVSAGHAAFDVTGPGLARILAEATTINPVDPGPSASVVFAGLAAILYRRAEGALRIHVERGHAGALWHWFTLAAEAGT